MKNYAHFEYSLKYKLYIKIFFTLFSDVLVRKLFLSQSVSVAYKIKKKNPTK